MTTIAAPERLLSASRRGLTIGGVALVGMTAFEAIAVSTAMPTVATALGGLTSYPLAFGIPAAGGIVGMVLAGSWGDRRGPVAPLAWGWALFVAGLLLAGTAGAMPQLVAGRAVQSFGSGAITIALYVVVARAYPESLRPRIFSAFASAWVLPALIGPAVAGFAVVHLGWRSVFLFVPIIAVLAAAAIGPQLRTLPAEPEAPSASGGGLKKSAAAVAASAAACLFSVAGQQRPVIAGVLVVASVLLLAGSIPQLLPAGTYRARRGLPTVILLRGLISAAFVGAEVFLPLLLSRERGLAPGQAGLILTIGAVGWSAGSAWQGRYSTAARRITMLTAGLSALALGIAVAATAVASVVPLAAVFVGWAIAGLGMGVAYPTLTVLTLALSEPGQSGRSTSSLQVNEALAQSFALALSGAVFAALFERSTWAPYVCGFAIAGIAAGLGAVLARRVR